MFKVALCVVVSVVFVSASPKPGWVQTPHGLRPRKCVHTVEEAHHSLKQVVGGVEAHYPNSGRTVFHAEDSECVENMRLLKKQREEVKAKFEMGGDGVDETWTGWLVYVIHSNDHFNLGYYHSLYTVPNQKPRNYAQLLYFFTGFQNPLAVGDNEYAIIQPVISYGYTALRSDWEMASWNCCPSAQSWHSEVIQIPAGAKVDTYLSADRRKGDTVIHMTHNGTNTTLRLSADTRRWTEATCALETYDTYKCNQFNSYKYPFVFGKQMIKDIYGSQISPKWSTTNKLPQCNAQVSYSNTIVRIAGKGPK